MTSSVVRYSESSMKCSFLTRSARLRVNKLPLQIRRCFRRAKRRTLGEGECLRGLFLEVLQIALEVVVGGRLGLEVGVDLAHLLADYVGDVAQRLLGGVLGDVPLEPRYVAGQVA